MRRCVIGKAAQRLRQHVQGQEGTDAAARAAYPKGSAPWQNRWSLGPSIYEVFEEEESTASDTY